MSSWISSRVNPVKKRIVNIPTIVPTFHILIATSGRPSLKNMLDSLKYELLQNDAITVVFDGNSGKAKSLFSADWLKGHKSKIQIIEEDPNLGYWGHGIRNKYQGTLEQKTTYIMHADDDDVYIKGSFNRLRQLCTDPNILYIAKMLNVVHGNTIPSQSHSIVKDDIGTPCGIIPFEIANKSTWELKYAGDFDYYNNLYKYAKNTVFLDIIIYKVL